MAEDISSSMSSLNVLAVTFDEDANAYEALTNLKELESQHQIGLRAAAVVGRAEDGEILSKDELGLDGLSATATGDDEDMRSLLAEIGLEVEIDHDTLLAEVSEQSPEAIDTAMAHLGGTVLRRPAGEVEAEVVAAEHAQREAKGKAPKELLHPHHEKQMEHIREKLAELMAKLHRHKGSRRRPPDLGPPRTGQA
jgi:hypothetical protein